MRFGLMKEDDWLQAFYKPQAAECRPYTLLTGSVDMLKDQNKVHIHYVCTTYVASHS